MSYKNLLYSVIMPVHNGELFLRKAIDSILIQTISNFELIIIENCSTDSSIEIIKSYDDPRIRLIIENDCGIVQGYNRGFKEAIGDYIIVHDQDDVSAVNRIEELSKYVIKNHIDLCGSSFNLINEKDNYIATIKTPQFQQEIIEHIFYNIYSIFNPTLIIKRDILENLNYFDINKSAAPDYDFILKAISKFKCGNIPKILLNYRIHKNNNSKKNPKVTGKNVKSIAKKHINCFSHLYKDNNYILSRFNFFYGNYLTSTKYMLISIKEKGINLVKLKYLLYSTIFVLPIALLRKRGLNHNKYVNKYLSFMLNKD